jgi:hypothetical protein
VGPCEKTLRGRSAVSEAAAAPPTNCRRLDFGRIDEFLLYLFKPNNVGSNTVAGMLMYALAKPQQKV